jgi:hypothetical protein
MADQERLGKVPQRQQQEATKSQQAGIDVTVEQPSVALTVPYVLYVNSY